MVAPIDILKQYWGYETFRTPQEGIINSLLEGRDTLALLPTGGGKSICFQVPGLMLDGLCLVISPLIALMRDQVDQLERRGIKAKALFSGMNSREIDITLDNCIYGNIKFLYVSPERLKSPLFLARAEQMKFSMIAIDEAHCISQWGYDFRPPYLDISTFIDSFGISKVIALTATATREVKEDITSKLEMQDPAVFTKSFARDNLSYSVFRLERKREKLLEVLRNVPGSAVVYVRSRKLTEEITAFLRKEGISADYYHAGLRGGDREQKQAQWLSNRIRVMVATNAFGMGIDKPDVRTVIHMDLPDTLEAYYQEAGRAGRDGARAYAILLYNEGDVVSLQSRLENSFISLEQIKRVYQALANNYKLAVGSRVEGSFDFHLDTFRRRFDLPAFEVFNAMKKLQEEGLLVLSESFYHTSQLIFLLNKEELYRFQIAHPNLERVTKTVLRLYGGESFTEYVKIKEGDVASLLKVTLSQVVEWLNLLHKYGVIDYHHTSSNDQLSFVGNRLDTNSLPIDGAKLAQRKSLAMDKARAVIDYVSNDSSCRTRQLQRYFDEISEEDCGICDYCVHKRKKGIGISPERIELILKSQGSQTISDMTLALNTTREELVEAARVLISEGRITLENEMLSLA